MHCNWLTPKAVTRRAGSKGWGSFAAEPIQRGERIAAFGGFMVDLATLRTLPQERQYRSIQVDADLYLVSGPEPEPGDYINHSCDPNCGMSGAIIVVAMRDIAIDEELTFDYAMCDTTDYSQFDCTCGAAACRGRVTADDWRKPALIDRYQGYHSSYVASLIPEQA